MNTITRTRLISTTALALLGAGLPAKTAFAQTADAPIVLAPIVVTGTKRPQDDAKLPVATTILDQSNVPPATLDPITEIARQSPGTNFLDFGRFGESYMTMRGLSTLGTAMNSLDSVIGISVDGVPTTLSGIGAPILDMERVEVLKGPQGTTFGRNAFAGAINIVSKPADGTRETILSSELGSDGHAFLEGTTGGWLLENVLAGRGTLRFQNYDGDVPNPITGQKEGGAQLGAGKASVRYTPDDTLTIDLSGGFSKETRHNSAFVWLESPNFPESGADVRPDNRQQVANGSLKVAKEFEPFTLTSTTSYQDVKIHNKGDFTDAFIFSRITGLPPAYFNDHNAEKVDLNDRERVFNQEVRLNSNEGSTIQWVAGASYFRSDYTSYRIQNAGMYAPTMNGTFDNRIESQTVAAFADASAPLGQGFNLSGGLRVAHDRQKLDALYVSNGFPGTLPAFQQDNTFSDTYVTGRMALSYEWNDRAMSYVSLARGYSSGGFEKTTSYAGYGLVTEAFLPATSWTYEIGTKAEINDRLRVSGAIFYNDVKDGQVVGFDTNTSLPFMTNQNFESYGIEANVDATLADGLELTVGGALIGSRLVDVSANSLSLGALPGNEVPQVPGFSANVGLSYRFLADAVGLPGEITLSGTYQYVGTRYADIQNAAKMDDYHILNAEIGWEKDNFRIYAFGRNLLDERPLSYAFTYPALMPGGASGTTAYFGRGRVVGIGSSVRW
ncbi:TonB-dependent receptor [Aquamicrobium sp. NLF2-7]|uniref:TonB-dependent receptor n=1 Tax=Aquamicrobium sp. NLF2-7 TaxID=2918753 RepID=UPI001EFC115C|nr:TonB-dependent receptor [Aquamicrobium sp. NLF2-7]MCG8273589.1 TonB-dependent receptor [Aquamicrobium sp. NLF2-7]